jgi:hypothetical protein
MIEPHDEELLEQLYWQFDARRKSSDERTAFKSNLRWYANKFLQQKADIPLEPTTEMIEAGAQRLVSFEENSTWPDSWTPLQVAAARNESERVWRSMWLAANGETNDD